MQTSVAVFLAFTVIYFASILLPFKASQASIGWTSQAAMTTGAVATFMVMKSNRLSMVQAALVFTFGAIITAITVMMSSVCLLVDDKAWQCQNLLPLHTMLFSAALLTGATAYIGYGLGSAMGLPLWATIAGSIALAPLGFTVAMPLASRGVGRIYDHLA